MYTGLVHLHNLLRWVVLIALLVAIIKLVLKKDALKASKVLLISAHTTLLLGLYQYFFGNVGFQLIKSAAGGMKDVMKDATSRFWAVEHAFSMILVIAFITIGHIKYKKSGKSGTTLVLYFIALLLILLMTPWPFKAGIGRPWYPGA
jgi:cell division protein FtsW (lipid II flippase)